jgi:hypothetical protein
MDVVRLPFNDFAHRHIRNLEALCGRSNRLSEQFACEIDKPHRAIYLGVYEGFHLIGCARVVPEPLGTVLLDALEVQPSHAARVRIERGLLDAARAIAAASGKRLSVIAYVQASQRWTELGFQPDAQALLTLS